MRTAADDAAALQALRACSPTPLTQLLRTTSTRRCSGTPDARFAMAKEASAGSRPRLLVLVRSDSAGRDRRGACFR